VRISTTTLESFRLFCQPDNEWMPESELIDTILGKFVPNRKVVVGQAFGAVLENPDRYRVDHGYRVSVRGVSADVIELSDDVMGPALALIDRPNTVFEAKALKRYGAHDVVARADQMVGARLIETKTRFASFDFDKYADGCQWRFMADIFEPVSITYHVFCMDEGEANGVVTLKDVHSFNLFPYAGLHDDCAELVAAFAEFCEARGLTAALDQRQREAA
jgi:hypothetical protein